MNLNLLAKNIAMKERFYGKKRKGKEIQIGDIKEILKITLHLLGKEIIDNDGEYMPLVSQLKEYGRKKLR
jgi:hypothetical protein